MKRIINLNCSVSSFILVVFCLLFFGRPSLVYAQDKIIAIVNNEVVTQKDLDDFLNFMRMQLSQEVRRVL